MKRLAKYLIGFDIRYLDCFAIKWFKKLRHEPNQIDIIWFGELVKCLGKYLWLRRKET